MALKESDDGVAINAAMALSNIGPGAKAAIPALVETLYRHKNDDAAVYAIEALVSIGKEAIPALAKEASSNSDWEVTRTVQSALMELTGGKLGKDIAY